MLHGICTPVCTPFTGVNQSFDEKAFLNHIDFVLEKGVHIIAVCGGTGEFAFLSKEEKMHMAEVAAKHIDGRAKLIVQTSAIRTEDAIEFSKHAEGVGADALMILPPFFEGPGDDGVFMHYEKISHAIKTPIMLYNIPMYSGYDITPAMYKRLAELPQVEYIKDSTADVMRMEQLIAVGAKLFIGCDYLIPHALASGATGCFWGASNIMPSQAVDIYNLAKAGKLNEVFALWEKMKAVNIFLWTTTYNAGVKAALRILGHDMGDCRHPILPLPQEEIEELKKHMSFLLK